MTSFDYRSWMRAPEAILVASGFIVHALWEFGHSPLYTDHDRGTAYVLWTRFHCTVGDVLILLGAFVLTAVLWRSRYWFLGQPIYPSIAFAGFGLGYTIFSEWLNTTVTAAWQYAPAMPQYWGIGLSPLLQWVVTPPVMILMLRRFCQSSVTNQDVPDESGHGV